MLGNFKKSKKAQSKISDTLIHLNHSSITSLLEISVQMFNLNSLNPELRFFFFHSISLNRIQTWPNDMSHCL